jgi:2-dehydro-3-deoxyphosphogluconate aldolase/(4S)-4-hydroxy-2-oxoglutarate aldolase
MPAPPFRSGDGHTGALRAALEPGVLAILRAPSADRFGELADALSRGGIRAIEFALTTEGALSALDDFASRAGDEVAIGAGTVLDAQMAEASIEAGAQFLVTPAVVPEVLDRARKSEVPVIPGALSPTEVLSAWRAGGFAVKLFPADAVGPSYLKHLAGPLPEIPLVATGGINARNAADWLSAGAAAVAVGTSLIGDAAAGGSLDELEERARQLIRAVRR